MNTTLLNKFKQTRAQTLKLVEQLKPEDFIAQPAIDVSPPKWHLGHSTWFFENFILKPSFPSYKIFNDKFAFVFNSYYQSQGERLERDKRSTLIRPLTEEIIEYRHYVDRAIVEFIESEKLDDNTEKFLTLGINHEQQHQELLISDIKSIYFNSYFKPAYQEKKIQNIDNPLDLKWLAVKEGPYEVGHKGDAFCFDNELGRHQVFIRPFEVANRLVLNREYLEFIEDGAYKKPSLWLSEGWDWVNINQIELPRYWIKEESGYSQFTNAGMQALNPDETLCHVSFYEAEAFARWSKKRLLTEFEWEVAAQQYGRLSQASHFLEQESFQPGMPADNQFFGTAWEWTNSAYLPYPGYIQEEGALGEYNGKFMVNQMVLRGGSCATAESHFRTSYRNFFHPHLRWQFTGIRLAK